MSHFYPPEVVGRGSKTRLYCTVDLFYSIVVILQGNFISHNCTVDLFYSIVVILQDNFISHNCTVDLFYSIVVILQDNFISHNIVNHHVDLYHIKSHPLYCKMEISFKMYIRVCTLLFGYFS